MPMINVSEETHLKVVRKQTKLMESGLRLRMQDIVDMIIIKCIDKVTFK